MTNYEVRIVALETYGPKGLQAHAYSAEAASNPKSKTLWFAVSREHVSNNIVDFHFLVSKSGTVYLAQAHKQDGIMRWIREKRITDKRMIDVVLRQVVAFADEA